MIVSDVQGHSDFTRQMNNLSAWPLRMIFVRQLSNELFLLLLKQRIGHAAKQNHGLGQRNRSQVDQFVGSNRGAGLFLNAA